MRALSLFSLALLVVVQAHVRGYFDPAQTPSLGYRNADSATADGQFSTSGPCGGQQQFGKNGITQISAGTPIKLTMSYNGGHADPANAFRLSMVCYGQTKGTSDSTLSTATNNVASCSPGPCPMTVSDQSAKYILGFTFGASTPAGTAINDKDYCTVSMLDQRNWGTCVDFQFNAAAVTPQPPPANLNTVVPQTGTYGHSSTGAVCDKSQDGAKCCCLSGTIQLTHSVESNTGAFSGTFQLAEDLSIGCDAANLTMTTTVTNIGLIPKPGAAAVLQTGSNIQISIDPMEVSATGGIVSLVNRSPNPPRVCSTNFNGGATARSYFVQQGVSTTTSNSVAAAVMIPLVVLGVAAVLFLLRVPLQTCLLNRSTGTSTKYMWIGFGLNCVMTILVLAACIAYHWSKTSGLSVGPWMACTKTGDCTKTLDLGAGGKGNIIATQFFILTSVFPALAVLVLPFLVKTGKLDEHRASTASYYSILYVGVSCFVAMCVWASFHYDYLAKFNSLGSWTPDWAIGLCCLAWLFAFSSAVVLFIWKSKASGVSGGANLQATSKAAKGEPSYPTTAPPAAAAPSYPVPAASYPTPQPLNQYGQQGYENNQQYAYGQQQQYGQPQYGQPGVDV